ncbi:D(1)-like dopamine receptor [Montipora foliosa]|uniref:D(1)-like dopamine receptor n=1 Tax=Montipora foliosa TaxID=591990 RepID=UPI0035F1FD9E
MNASSNTVSGASPPSDLPKALQTTILCCTFLANLLGNICVCLAVTRGRALRQRPSASILASLAISDLASLSFVLFRLVWLYDLEAACNKYQYFFTLVVSLLYVSSIHICLLSCDRYVAIVHCLRYRQVVTNTKVGRALLVAWGLPLASTIIVPCFYQSRGRTHYTAALIGCAEQHNEPNDVFKVHTVFNFTLFVVIPFLVMIFVDCRIAKIAWSQNNRIWPGENLTPELTELRRKRKKEMKWMRTIIIVVGAFAFCYLPTFISAVPAAQLGPSRVPMAWKSIFILMTTAKGALNPIIYIFTSKEFNLAFRIVVRKALPDTLLACIRGSSVSLHHQ